MSPTSTPEGAQDAGSGGEPVPVTGARHFSSNSQPSRRSVVVRRVATVVVAAVVIVADQTTKTWALHLPATTIQGNSVQGRHVFGPLYFNLTFNHGIAFGIGAGITPIVEAVVIVLIVGLILAGRRAAASASLLTTLGLGLLLGGALSNLGDRLFRDHGGAVIDFIDVAQTSHHEYWPVFNVADACVVVGAIIVAVEYSRRARRGPAGHHRSGPSDD